ncbi:Protein argonaute [Phytophthora cactorum]|uniref:Protein argonaute n=2 Tax=Phytophthora cactorum TaxID=29920 RepID=A0A8T1DAP7_9STRA|nr:Protein argonaute [Phytophthora cactorum]KAG2840000.1 Protein argonaute [Phytophthora cactorum]KAG2923085.1 Protein argonaute [Phytophthora cactorum]KAG2937836.1 Protein argonaute [Phytophthora cactorum]KAG2951196.1 Protein argonaute [Phytophthora cactorum]
MTTRTAREAAAVVAQATATSVEVTTSAGSKGTINAGSKGTINAGSKGTINAGSKGTTSEEVTTSVGVTTPVAPTMAERRRGTMTTVAAAAGVTAPDLGGTKAVEEITAPVATMIAVEEGLMALEAAMEARGTMIEEVTGDLLRMEVTEVRPATTVVVDTTRAEEEEVATPVEAEVEATMTGPVGTLVAVTMTAHVADTADGTIVDTEAAPVQAEVETAAMVGAAPAEMIAAIAAVVTVEEIAATAAEETEEGTVEETEEGIVATDAATIVEAATAEGAIVEETEDMAVEDVAAAVEEVAVAVVESLDLVLDEWIGRAGVREVSAEDPDLQQEFLICRRPGLGRGGKSAQMQVNYFNVSLDAAPPEIFKYHVDVERSPDLAADSKYGPSGADQKDETMGDDPKQEGKDEKEGKEDKDEKEGKEDKDVEMSDVSAAPKREQRPERPLPRSLVRNVINAALRQYEAEFGGIRVVHDGMSAMFAPAVLPWESHSKTFVDVNPDGPSPTPPPPPRPAAGDAPRRPFRGPRTFVVKIKLAETISTHSLKDYYSNPDVNVMPVLQALDVAARHLGAQRLITVGRNFFSMKKTFPLKGGKELCWGYHQAIRVADGKLLMNVDQAATVFYAPKELMELVLPALNARSANDIRSLSDRDARNLARALRKIEVVPTHRKDRKRAIFGISAQPANETIQTIKGESMSVADYFNKRYNINLRYPNLPLVNVGSKRPGKENWLPIELCEVAPGQRCANINDLDTAEIIRQTSQPPRARQETIIDQVRQAGFENDPYLAAFGMKVEQRLETTEARVMDPPDVQYANVSERPSGGQWNLRDKRFVEGATMRNWGVVISANVGERDVQGFIRNLVDMAGKSGLTIEDSNPHMVHMDQYRGAQVEELMKMCFKELEARNRGPPQLIMVIKQDKSVGSYSDIKRMSDTVLGIPSQCIVSQNVRSAKPQYCANVCLKINMKLSGKNSILREPLPLVSTAPTIIIGADVEHPRSGMGSRPSIASVVASLDRYSAKYVARVAAQKASSDIQLLPHLLRDLFLAYYQSTNRKPEHVIYYRDGVSEGQYYDILQTEMRALRKAFKMISEGYNPPVTFIIVNKRHHMRAFPANPRDADRKGNVVPGTVIDTGIVDSHRFDFFLYGHSGIQGTSVPCHYTVLHDENKMSAEDVQRLTYHLGYTFARCTRSVSFATPAYYAHLAAGRARFFLNEGSDGASTVGSFNSNSSNFDFTELHSDLKNCMFFI